MAIRPFLVRVTISDGEVMIRDGAVGGRVVKAVNSLK